MDQYAGYVGGVAALGAGCDRSLERKEPRPRMAARPDRPRHVHTDAGESLHRDQGCERERDGHQRRALADRRGRRVWTDRVWNDDRYIRGMASAVPRTMPTASACTTTKASCRPTRPVVIRAAITTIHATIGAWSTPTRTRSAARARCASPNSATSRRRATVLCLPGSSGAPTRP